MALTASSLNETFSAVTSKQVTAMAPRVHPQMSGGSQLQKFRFKRLKAKDGDSSYSYTRV